MEVANRFLFNSRHRCFLCLGIGAILNIIETSVFNWFIWCVMIFGILGSFILWHGVLVDRVCIWYFQVMLGDCARALSCIKLWNEFHGDPTWWKWQIAFNSIKQSWRIWFFHECGFSWLFILTLPLEVGNDLKSCMYLRF